MIIVGIKIVKFTIILLINIFIGEIGRLLIIHKDLPSSEIDEWVEQLKRQKLPKTTGPNLINISIRPGKPKSFNLSA